MAKVTFATREFIDTELDKLKQSVDSDLKEYEIKNTKEHEAILQGLGGLETNINDNIKKRIDDVEKNFNDSFGSFKTEVEGDLEELSKNILVENIRYKNELNPELSNVKDSLDRLLYFDTEVTSLNSSAPYINLMGTVLQDVNITWAYNKPSVVSQSIDDTPIAKTNRSYTYPSSITTNKTILLKFNDGVKEFCEEIEYVFVNYAFYGTITSLTDISLVSLQKAFATSKETTLSLNAGKGEYIIYAIPVRFGVPRFFVGGLEGGFIKEKEIDVTNTAGYSEKYAIWRSARAGLGATIVDIK